MSKKSMGQKTTSMEKRRDILVEESSRQRKQPVQRPRGKGCLRLCVTAKKPVWSGHSEQGENNEEMKIREMGMETM